MTISPRFINHRLPSSISGASTAIPSMLMQKVGPRLRILTAAAVVVLSVAWVGVNLIEGEFLKEFENIREWGGPTLLTVSSALVLGITFIPRVSATALVRVGLFYQVAVSYGIALGTYWGAFEGLPASALTQDRVGLTWVAVWLIAYAALVPASRRGLALALFASALAVPVVFAVNVGLGIAPMLPPLRFFLVLVLPYLLCATLAQGVAKIIFDLGRHLRQARELGAYRLKERLGKGGMGEVWRADHGLLARPAAVKLIQSDALGSGNVQAAMARFEREAQITASLQSPHTVALYDFGVSAEGTLFYAMELLEGLDLERVVENHGPLPVERVVYVLERVCDSLAEAHARGLIHRDIKPANIFLAHYALEYDFVKVLDFGLAKYSEARPEPAVTEPPSTITQANVIIGTPAYLAPEIALGRGVPDGRSDLYSLGCVAYWLLTGKAIFAAETPMLTMLAHATQAPPPLKDMCTNPLPAGLEELLLACLQKDPEQRPPSALHVSQQLRALRLERPWTPERAAAFWQQHALADTTARA